MQVGIGQQAKAGRAVCGDSYLVQEIGPKLVVAIADGLGSGEKASRSAKMATQGLSEHANASLADVMTYCHYVILAAGGVGTMLAILRLDQRTCSLEFAGVGNIRFLAHSQEVIQPITRFGYLGVRLPSLRVFRFPYSPGDSFVMHTDGISTRFHVHNHLKDLERGAQALADRIMHEYSKSHDDATVIVVKT